MIFLYEILAVFKLIVICVVPFKVSIPVMPFHLILQVFPLFKES